MSAQLEPISVFLNVPFDDKYEKLFVALIGTLVAVGLRPRTVLELPERGAGRLARLRDLISECRFSIHDLSRVGTPARFNMPFELGLACAAHLANEDAHSFIVMEAEPYRLQKTLSDLNGRDPIIHRNSQRGVINGMLDVFENSQHPVDFLKTKKLVRELQTVSKALLKQRGLDSMFRRRMFDAITVAAMNLSEKAELRD